jgi:hypothetical protein
MELLIMLNSHQNITLKTVKNNHVTVFFSSLFAFNESLYVVMLKCSVH